MDKFKSPYIITFNSIGSADIGYISVAQEFEDISFKIRRVYWTYYTPQNITRGGHANIKKELVMVAVSGTIIISTEMQTGEKAIFELNKPNIGLFIPKLCWHTMQYSHNAVQMVLASNLYDEDDYLRDYSKFKIGV